MLLVNRVNLQQVSIGNQLLVVCTPILIAFYLTLQNWYDLHVSKLDMSFLRVSGESPWIKCKIPWLLQASYVHVFDSLRLNKCAILGYLKVIS